MRFTDEEIRADLLDAYDEIRGAAFPDDLIVERADGYVPIYTNEIISDWAEMPNEFDDAWLEFGEDASRGIVRLMSTDLFVYYESQTRAIWDAIVAEKAGE